MTPHHLVERLIADAQMRGEFDKLPGLGKPIPDLDASYDELWWVRKWMERENLRPEEELRAALRERRAEDPPRQ